MFVCLAVLLCSTASSADDTLSSDNVQHSCCFVYGSFYFLIPSLISVHFSRFEENIHEADVFTLPYIQQTRK